MISALPWKKESISSPRCKKGRRGFGHDREEEDNLRRAVEKGEEGSAATWERRMISAVLW